jgi:hypothetical protein
MASKRGNPKKNPAARRRRPDRAAGSPGQARLGLRDISQLMSVVPPEALPLVGVTSVWLWNLAQEGHAAAHCVDGCLTLHHALANYGIASHVEAVAARIGDGHHAAGYGDTNSREGPAL